jgi:predicted  nucleic acid-binding Zn-ribbon protein
MDFQARVAQYQAHHITRKGELQRQLAQKGNQINHLTQNHVQKHPRGSALYTQKKQLETRLVEEKKRLYDESLTQQQKLNEQFATDREAIDAEIFRVGRQIAGTDEGLKALVTEHAAIQRELTNLNTKGLV